MSGKLKGKTIFLDTATIAKQEIIGINEVKFHE